LILSGKYGLIDAVTPIRDYDFRMTPSAAIRLRPSVLERLRQVVGTAPISTIGVCLGRDYRHAIEGLEEQLPEGTTVEVIGGGLGRRLTKLRQWLNRPGAENDNASGELTSCDRPKRTASQQTMKQAR